MRLYSTNEVAKLVHIHRSTLNRWIASGKLKVPPIKELGPHSVRLWSNTDAERLRRFKQANYRKGRGRKPKP